MHGHVCGGMLMGYVAGLSALKALNVERERNMDKMVIIKVGDKHAVGFFADGVQFMTEYRQKGVKTADVPLR
ncbi:FmdE family protein [Calditerrivibrio sp.]|jgi:formylmethanofuran dehydrogenase subunit E|uniref:FmdE family protein n=1 Tax=Calditerrivibrio sp. TaxID=2792612 RepID=UPI003D0C9E74